MWWRVYYERDTFTSEQGTPFDAPRQGVQIVVQGKDSDYEIVHGRDYFYWEPERGGWHCSDIFGAFDHLVRTPRQCLLFGRMMADSEWRDLFERVKLECGARTGRLNREPLREPFV